MIALAAVITHRYSQSIPPPAYQFKSNIWFEADLFRVLRAIADPFARDATDRSQHHLLFILLAHPPAALLRWWGWAAFDATRLELAAFAGLWLATLYGVLRLVGLRRPDAVLFALLGGTSAAAAFWLTVPETYALGSITIMAALGLVALRRYRSVPEWASVAANAASLSVTTTNWMAGLIATAANHPWRRAVRITLTALAVVAVAWGTQKFLYPGVKLPTGRGTLFGHAVESSEFFSPRAGGPRQVLKVFFFYSAVMPGISTVSASPPDHPDRLVNLSVQRASMASLGLTGAVALAAWVILLCTGVWALVAAPGALRVRVALGVTLIGQIVLALIFGHETFLYALNFLSLLVLLTGLAATTRLRPVILVVGVVACLFGAINNYGRRQEAVDRAHDLLQSPIAQKQLKRAKRADRGWKGCEHAGC